MRCFLAFLMCLSLSAQAPPERPKVFGVAHYSIFVSDLAKARAFYEDFLGYEESFTLPGSKGLGVRRVGVSRPPLPSALSWTKPPVLKTTGSSAGWCGAWCGGPARSC